MLLRAEYNLNEEVTMNALLTAEQRKIRIGTQDLKIAAIPLANDALLQSANLRDFERVPELSLKNWLVA